MHKKHPTNTQEIQVALTADLNAPHDTEPYINADKINRHPGGWFEFMDEETYNLFSHRVTEIQSCGKGASLFKIRRWTEREQKMADSLAGQPDKEARNG